MSISDEINKLKKTLKDSYSVVESKGVTVYTDKNYDNLVENLVRIPTEVINHPLTIEPSITDRVYMSDDSFTGYDTIVVDAVTADIDVNIQSENILKGVTILDVPGSIVLDGTTIHPSTLPQSITHPGVGGYASITVEPVTSAIDTDITADNIRAGVNILGVEGTVIESHTYETLLTANGTYAPAEGFNGFSEVEVRVEDRTYETTLTENGTYIPAEGYNGFSRVEVDVEDISPIYIGYLDEIETVMEEHTIPVTGEYSLLSTDLDNFLDNLSEDLSDVIAGEGTSDITLLVGQTATITSNGIYTPDIGYTGFTEVDVFIEPEEPLLQDITITQDGTYTAGTGYDGLGVVEVNVGGEYKNCLDDINTALTNLGITPPEDYADLDTTITNSFNAILAELQEIAGTTPAPGPSPEPEVEYYKIVEQAWTQPTLVANGTMGGSNMAVAAETSGSARGSFSTPYVAFSPNTGYIGTYRDEAKAWVALYIYYPEPIKLTQIYFKNQMVSSSFEGGIYGAYLYAGDEVGSRDVVIKAIGNVSNPIYTGEITGNDYYQYYTLYFWNGGGAYSSSVSIGNIAIAGVTQESVPGTAEDWDYKVVDGEVIWRE